MSVMLAAITAVCKGQLVTTMAIEIRPVDDVKQAKIIILSRIIIQLKRVGC